MIHERWLLAIFILCISWKTQAQISPSPSPSPDDSSGDGSDDEILEIVLLAIAFVIVGVAAAACWKKKTSHQSSNSTKTEVSTSTIIAMDIPPPKVESSVSQSPAQNTLNFKDITLREVIGTGAGGRVYRGTYKGADVAVKDLYIAKMDKAQFESEILHEADMMSRFQHPNVLKLYGVSFNRGLCYIVTELCAKPLSAVIHSQDRFTVDTVRTWLLEVAKGMAFLHDNNILHRDLKPANILLDHKGEVRICDFGLAREWRGGDMSMTAAVGTPIYMSPEMISSDGSLRNKGCGNALDVYSYAMCACEMITRQPPFFAILTAPEAKNMTLRDLGLQIVAGVRPAIPSNCPPVIANLIRSCWQKNADKRPTFKQIIEILEKWDDPPPQGTDRVATV